MKQFITFFLILISLIFISCDTNYSGEVSDTFKMYYAVEGEDSLLLYSLEYSANNGVMNVDSLEDSYTTDFLEAAKSDSFYMKVTNFEDDTLRMIISKGYVAFKDSTILGAGEYIIQGVFPE